MYIYIHTYVHIHIYIHMCVCMYVLYMCSLGFYYSCCHCILGFPCVLLNHIGKVGEFFLEAFLDLENYKEIRKLATRKIT